MSRLSRSLLAAFALLTVATAATARDARCPRLLAELAALPDGGARSGARLTQYQDAIDRQTAEYERTADYARTTGCDIDPDAGGQCRGLGDNLRRMRRNLDSLEAQYQRLSDNAGQSREDERQRLKAMLADLGCDGTAPPAGKREVGLFEGLFGPDEADPGIAPAPRAPAESDYQMYPMPDDSLAGRTVRTICVRKCDGFYFPISFATDSSHFSADAQACAQRCPTADVELYAYDTYAQQPDEAVSTTSGATLKDMANAFRFRTSYDPSCFCRPTVGTVAQSVAPAGDALKRLDEATLDAAMPKQPKTGDAPLDPGKVIETTTAAGQKKKIRVVGPVSMPAP